MDLLTEINERLDEMEISPTMDHGNLNQIKQVLDKMDVLIQALIEIKEMENVTAYATAKLALYSINKERFKL